MCYIACVIQHILIGINVQTVYPQLSIVHYTREMYKLFLLALVVSCLFISTSYAGKWLFCRIRQRTYNWFHFLRHFNLEFLNTLKLHILWNILKMVYKIVLTIFGKLVLCSWYNTECAIFITYMLRLLLYNVVCNSCSSCIVLLIIILLVFVLCFEVLTTDWQLSSKHPH